jgi:ERCC4-type nuclease
MFIKIDTREHDLLRQINHLISIIPVFNKIIVKTETLPIGDIIICDENEEKVIIERKTTMDLLASIKDGRYEEQSYRLTGLNHPNHNIIYLIEGDLNYANRFKTDNKVEKLTLYSAMFSLNYYKGFSLFRTSSLDETATVICNMVYKLNKEKGTNKTPFYKTFKNDECKKNTDSIEQTKDDSPITDEPIVTDEIKKIEIVLEEQTEKDYVNVVKRVKKENITTENIGEIMLCQIPGISSVTALAILEKYKSLSNLIKEIENNNDCLKDICYTNSKGQIRKINKSSLANIIKYLNIN